MGKKTFYRVLIAVFCVTALLSTLFYSLSRTAYEHTVAQSVQDTRCDYLTVLALIKAESNFEAAAVSPKGAAGLMQLMPSTARWVWDMAGLEGSYSDSQLFNVQVNIVLGVWYLDYLLSKFTPDFALAAYNAGEGVVAGWLADGVDKVKDIPFDETRAYIAKIHRYREFYRFIGK